MVPKFSPFGLPRGRPAVGQDAAGSLNMSFSHGRKEELGGVWSSRSLSEPEDGAGEELQCQSCPVPGRSSPKDPRVHAAPSSALLIWQMPHHC